MAHRNSDNNDEPHHLYEIIDKVDNDVFKYGISSDPVEPDGLSRRLRRQIKFLNLIDKWARFFGRILIVNIPGRKEAKRIESEHIQAYKEKHGEKPRGNLND